MFLLKTEKLIISTNLFLLFEEVKELFLLFDGFSGGLLLGHYDWSLQVYRVLLKVHRLWGLGLEKNNTAAEICQQHNQLTYIVVY